MQKSSHDISKKRSPKQRIPKAVVQAAKTARNPAQDFRNRKQEIGRRDTHIRQKAQKFMSRGQRWRHTPASRAAPPRDPDRANQAIHYQKRLDPVIAHQQTQRRQNFQDQTNHALSKAVRELQQQLHLVRADSAIPEGNDLTTTESQIISVENIPLPGTVSNFPLRSNRENTTQVTQSNQGEGNIGTVNSKPNSRTESPILEAQKVDFDALEREINRRQSTSSEGSSSSSSSGSS